jgi:hypothetical protein
MFKFILIKKSFLRILIYQIIMFSIKFVSKTNKNYNNILTVFCLQKLHLGFYLNQFMYIVLKY